ncbi:MAG: hypothetical protein ABSF95_06270 [Verrucomicrobiota bacterium]
MKTSFLYSKINRFIAPTLFPALLACNICEAAMTDFGDNTEWMPTVFGLGVQMNNVANGFQVGFATDAHPGGVVSSSYPTVIAAGYQSTFELRGDFTIDVSYSLNVWPAASGVRLGIGLMPYLGVQRECTIYTSGDAYSVNAAGFSYVSTTDRSGMMQLARVGGTLTGSYWNPTSQSWVAIRSAQGYSEDFGVGLSAWTDSSTFGHQSVELTMNNLAISAQTILSGPYPLPYWVQPTSGGGIPAVPEANTLWAGALALAFSVLGSRKALRASLTSKGALGATAGRP